MNDPFSTPAQRNAPISKPIKRDSLAAELERDPQLSTSKRQQRTQAFTSTIAHASLERQLAATQANKLELQTKIREKDLLIDKLERDRRWFADREKEEREEKEKERAERDEEKLKMENELRTLRSSLTSLHEQQADLQDVHSALSRSTNQTISSQRAQITTLNRQVSLVLSELEQYKNMVEERGNTIQTLESQLEDLAALQDTRKDTQELGDMAVVRDELHRQAEYMRSLERTNEKLSAELVVLREKQTSTEVLKEEKRGLEMKVRTLEEMRERVVRLEAEVEAGRREREEWADKETSSTSQVSVSITSALSDLRLQHARLLEAHGATSAALRQREAQLLDAERREAETRTSMEAHETTIRTLKATVERCERRVELAERDVSFLQALLASYTAEETREGGSMSGIDGVLQRRVLQLEELLGGYKETNDHLTEALDIAGINPEDGGRSIQRLREDLEEEQKTKATLQAALEKSTAERESHLTKIDELEQTLYELSGEIAGGRHVPQNTRVLCMKDNPEQQWFDLRQAAMDRLKGENEALMKRLKEVEMRLLAEGGWNKDADEIQKQESGANEGGEGDGALVPRESWELVCREKNELEGIVKQKEKRYQRLQQVFTAKSAEFREAIASILGVKLAFYPNGQVRVTSMYDLNASFVFQPTSLSASASGIGGAKMQLIAQGEGVPPDLSALMQSWIEREQCIPGFLAIVTLECYEKMKEKRGRGGQTDVEPA